MVTKIQIASSFLYFFRKKELCTVPQTINVPFFEERISMKIHFKTARLGQLEPRKSKKLFKLSSDTCNCSNIFCKQNQVFKAILSGHTRIIKKMLLLLFFMLIFLKQTATQLSIFWHVGNGSKFSWPGKQRAQRGQKNSDSIIISLVLWLHRLNCTKKYQ